jgi:CheY-like chemotaxis protein
MNLIKILWTDDEIENLRSHIIFLESKGYSVETATNGEDALDMLEKNTYDIVFLDENMPGLSGIETLSKLKNNYPNIPVVMITKSEEESIMEDAIGSKISDYLIKPVNPNQILLCLKKNLENKKLVSDKTTHSYHMEFRQIGMEISPNISWEEWQRIYKKIVNWELKLSDNADADVLEILEMQKNEANTAFSKFIENNYVSWLHENDNENPLMSHTLVQKKMLSRLSNDKSCFLLMLDNLRYDQWKVMQNSIEDFYRVEEENICCSILPTVTQYARNAFFAGLMPLEIQKKYPDKWYSEEDEGSKNQFEEFFMQEQLQRFGKKISMSYHKVLDIYAGKKYLDLLPNLINNNLNILVYNFVDLLSHARTEMKLIKELTDGDAAYRSITLSWFKHSPLYEIIQYISAKRIPLFIASDHGSVKVTNPVKIIGDKSTNTNLRYKIGKNLNYNPKEVFCPNKTEDVFLPKINVSSSYIFAKESDFFAYPNNYNYYVNYYRNSCQHGGISMQEMMIPFVYLQAK